MVNEIEKLKTILQEKNIKRKDLAKMIGQDIIKVNMWFTRKSIPKDFLKPVANAVGVTTDYLLS